MRLISFATVILSSIAFLEATTLYHELSVLNATIFLGLVDKAGLASMLQAGDSYTLLVPSNHAFSKIPAAELASTVGNTQALMNLIQYHLIRGVHLKHDFHFGKHYFLNSTNGHVIRIYRTASGIHFNQARATETDVRAPNGVIYVINTVLDVPEGTVIDILANKDYHISKFLAIVQKSGLHTNYAMPTGINRYTMFAPNDAAMDALPQWTLQNLGKDTTYLRLFIEYHVHSGNMHAAALMKHHSISTTLPGRNIAVSTNANGNIMLDHVAQVIMTDIEAENGVVYVINHVLMPPILLPIVG